MSRLGLVSARLASFAHKVSGGLELYVLVPLFTTLLLCVIWLATFNLIGTEGASAKRVAAESSKELVETYKAHMVRNLGAIDQTLKTIKYSHELKRTQSVLPELRKKGLLPPALVFTVRIADRHGEIIDGATAQESTNVAGQQYFQVHRNLDSNTLFVSRATQNKASGEWELQFTRRLNAADGSFDGIAIVAAAPDYFTSSYERSRFGDHGVIGLLGTDGVFLARRTGDLVSWSDAVNFQPIATATQISDGMSLINPWDGVRRYTQMKPLPGFPLIAVAGLSEEEQLAEYHRHRETYLWRAVAISVLLAAIAAILSHLSLQLVKSRMRRRKSQETYYAASDASRDAFYVLRSLCNDQGVIIDFILDDTNGHGAKLYGLCRERMLGRSLCKSLPRLRDDGTFDAYVKVAETGVIHEQEWQNHIPSVKAEWLYRQVVQVDGGIVAIVRDISERKREEFLRIEQGQVLEMIAAGISLEDVLKRLILLVESQMTGMMGVILLHDKEGLRLRQGVSPSLPAAYMQAFDSLRIGPQAGSCGTAAYRREPVIVADIQQDPLWDDCRELAMQYGLRSCWATPILSHQKDVLGTFALYSREVRTPTAAENQLVDMAIRIAGIAIERKNTEDRIRHMAHHDALTGLPNRILLEDRIQQAMLYAQRYDRQVTVAFIDLDNFKLINDSLGHKAGDELLKTVAKRMAECVRATDIVVRLGGDEFVIVLLDQTGNTEALAPKLQMIRDAIAEPVYVGGQKLQITSSIGLAMYPFDGSDAETLLMNADAAMYRAKEQGRNNYQFYMSEMNTKIHEKLSLQEGLRNAIEQSEFLLLYQPQVDLRSGKIFGVEALIRWQHPTLGMVSPIKFIPLAEETGLIVPIGDWVLHTACKQNKAWQDAGMPPITVSVNVSPRQFKDNNLIRQVAHALKESGLDACYLELEMTESLIMQDLQQAIETMRELKAMGVQLSIDDFGTGYSSLSALKVFPIVRLKLDQSFVRDLPYHEDDKAIAMAVISLGHKLNLKVIAEGVETAQQLAFLRDNDCDEMQGYHFSKPVLSHEIEKLFAVQAVSHR